MNRSGRESNSTRIALTLLVVCLLGIGVATVPMLAGADGSEQSAVAEQANTEPAGDDGFTLESTATAQADDVVATFTATNVGDGFISFDENNIDDARAEGLSFSEGDIVIEGEIYENGSWQSTGTSFKTLNTADDGSGFDAQPRAINGLEGEFDTETGRMTADGTLQIELLATGDTFQFDLAMVTGTSNGDASTDDGLKGEFDANIDDGGFVNFVDNEYTVPEPSGNPILDQQIGLPIEEPGLAWFDLHLNLETQQVAPQTGGLTGTVTDQSGNPIEGATVDVLDSAKSTQTAADGSYSFEGLDVGTYDLEASADQYQTTTTTVEIAGGETTEQTLELQPEPANLELSIEGSVVTAGEQLEVIGTISNTGGTAATETATLSLGDLATIEESIQVAPGETVQISETVETTEADAGEYTAELTVNDKRADTEVVVRNPFDQKQPVATFTAQNTGEGLISFSSTLSEAAAEGSRFPQDQIVIEGEIYDDNTWQSTNIEIPKLQTSADQVEVFIDVPDGITGEIDREAGTMTANGEFDISVVGRDSSFQFVLEATTGQSGGLPGDAQFNGQSGEIVLVENEFTVDQTTGDPIVDTQLELPANESGENWFSLGLDMLINDNPTGTVAGTVRDQNGNPVEDATVLIAGAERQTGSDGRYEVSGIGDGEYDLTVSATGTETRTVQVDVSPAQRVTRDVQLTLTGGLTGSVVDQNGNPIDDATVSIGGQTAQTDGQGQYTVDGIGVGTQTLTVTTPDGAERTVDVTIPAGEQTEQDVELGLVGSLTGVVDTSSGRPASGVPVSIEGTTVQTTTSDDGSFTLQGLPVGTQTLVVNPDGLDAQNVEVEIRAGDQTEQDVTLDLTGDVSGTVITAVDSPFQGATVRLVDESRQSVAETTSGSDGGFEFTDIPPGEYGLVAESDVSGRQQQTITVAPGESTEQTLELSQPRVNVRVNNVQATAGTNTEVTAVVENIGAASTTETVTLGIDNVASTSQTVELDIGERKQVTLELTPSSSGEFPITATAGEETDTGTLTVTGGGDVIANFRAKAVGDSYVSFAAENKQAAEADSTPFPDANEVSGSNVLWIEGIIFEDGTWQATAQNLPNLKKSGLNIAVDSRSTMTGTIDPESESMSVNADFLTTILIGDNPNFKFSTSPSTGQSNGLSGSGEFERNTLELDSGESYSASVSLVDNAFAVNDKTGNKLADTQLGLPSTEPSNNWFKLNLDLEIREGKPEVGSVSGTVTDEDGNPINNATVRANGKETRTDSDGSYTLERVTTGDATVVANALNYEQSTAEITIEEDSTTEQDLELTPGEPEYTLAVEGTSVTEGETLTVRGAIANTGTAIGEDTLRLTVTGLSTTTEDLELRPQSDTTIVDEVQTSKGDAGDYQAVLQLGDKTKRTTITIEEADDTDDNNNNDGETATFTATSTGGFISFDETNIDDARSEGIAFPDGSEGSPIVIEGDISADGTWQSTNIQFPMLNTAEDGGGFDAQATFPDGLSGKFDPESGLMTAEGTLSIQLPLTGNSFQFEIAMTTETSNGAATNDGLEGAFESGDPVSVSLVDNEYTVDTTTESNILNNQLGLPIADPGLAWLELGLSMDITASEDTAETGTVTGTVEDSSGTPVSGVTISVDGERQSATTSSDGSYELSNVPAGTQTLSVSADGYEETTADVQVEPDSTTEQSFDLTALDPSFEATLDAAETSPGTPTTVTGTIENTGGPGSEAVTITVGEQSMTETVELGSGESTTVEFEFQTDQSGEYSAAMAVGDQTQAAAANVVVSEQSNSGTDDSGGSADGGFIATSRGGFTSFTESSLSAARENTGVTYPSAEEGTPIEIGATIDGTTWTASSVNISFPTMTTADGIEVNVRAPNGLEGTIDRESGEMTATGQLEVEVGDGNTFTFELDATTAESGEMSGEANFGSDSPTVTLVDNQFTIPEKTGDPLINGKLGLPTETQGENWFELELGLEFVDSDDVDSAGNSGQQQDSGSDDTGGSAFTTLGLVGGLAGLGLAGLFLLLVLARRLINLIDPDPEM